MHEFRRFIQGELDARGWRQADLVRASGLSRQHVSQILTDTRDNLGQMPDAATLTGIADGLGVPAERVRTAAARSLVGYTDSGEPLTPALQDVSIDALLNEIRRRVENHERPAEPADPPTTEPGAPRPKDEKTDKNPEDRASNVEPLRPRRRRGRDFSNDPIIEADAAADDRGPDDESEADRARRRQDEHAEGAQDDPG